MKRNYESMVIISPSVGEDGAKKENEAIVKFITKLGGELIKTDEWGKRELAYEINKVREGYYFINYFKLDPSKVKKLQDKYRIMDNLMRYNILVLEEK